MKKIFIILSILFNGATLLGQTLSTDQNYIQETTVRVAGKTQESQLTGLPVNQANRTIRYFDGLGRPLQTVQWQATGTMRDLVTPIVYDAFGREDKKYLPYPSLAVFSNGSYKSNAINEQTSFYNDPTNTSAWNAPGVLLIPGAAFSKTVFEASPLNRVLEQGAPGAPWQPSTSRTTTAGRTVVSEYGTNVTADSIKLWTVNSSGASTTALYANGKLYKTTAKDENWVSGKGGTVDEYKDFDGHVVVKRVWETDTKSLSTYYVYDDLGNLRYVLPPAINENGYKVSSFTENDAIFKNFIYGYHYDGRKRLIEKQVPGKDWEYLVYNKLDQVVMTQDAVQRSKSPQEWQVTKYDAFGRVILTGIFNLTGTAGTSYRAAVQTSVDAQANQWEDKLTTGIGYTTDKTYPTTALASTLTINYYDDYNFPGNTFGPPTGNQMQAARTKTLLTGTKVNILGSSTMLLTVNYYDDEGRVIQSKSQHHLNGTDVIDNTYNFPGELTASTRTHTANGVTTTIATKYDYDHMGRKVATKESINGAAEIVLSKMVYNEVGQLTSKSVHSTDNGANFLKKTDFAYNERGWLTASNTPGGFVMALSYNDGVDPQYNGNIAFYQWLTGAGPWRMYIYKYDKLNRLTSGVSSESRNEQGITYDAMGNIMTLTRDAYAPQVYNYTGNKLNTVTGGALRSYTYDVNGNALSDGVNGFTYNLLNLPATVTGPNASTYTYDATGRKLTRVKGSVTTHYIDGIQYSGSGIDFIQTEEGIARPVSGVYKYEYTLKDQLGNARYSFNSSGTQVQADDYYPFGKTFNSYVLGARNNYLYNSKELQDGLEQYDYGARFYDPVIGRWNVVDPLAEKVGNLSPYHYGLNNPVLTIDPNGMEGKSTHTDQFGNVLAVYDDHDLGVYKHNNNADGTAPTEANIDKRHEKSTSAGGEKMGETEFWDEFKIPGTKKAGGQIHFSNDPEQSWDVLVKWGNDRAKKQDLIITQGESKLHEVLDIKNNAAWADAGPMTGRLLNGKYATARSAGNYLAGLNGVTGTFQGKYISGETYMKLAGAYQQKEFTKVNILRILMFGSSFGPAPYYGEESYSGRRILQGINAGSNKK